MTFQPLSFTVHGLVDRNGISIRDSSGNTVTCIIPGAEGKHFYELNIGIHFNKLWQTAEAGFFSVAHINFGVERRCQKFHITDRHRLLQIVNEIPNETLIRAFTAWTDRNIFTLHRVNDRRAGWQAAFSSHGHLAGQ